MAAAELEGALFDMGGMGLPVANKENKKLEAEVQTKEREIAALQLLVDEHKDRTQAIRDHLKNVRQELQHTQGLYEARKKGVETEDHMRQIAEREEGRLRDEMNRLGLERAELKEKMNAYENMIFRTNHKTEDLKHKMNWDQQALEAWLEESARQDEDAMTLAKYARADESKIKEMTLKLEQIHESVVAKKRQLDSEVTETLTSQIELDKTAEAFRHAHSERQELIGQWEHTIERMKRRDSDMDRAATGLARLKAEIKAKEDLIREKQEFLDHEKENNVEKEKKLSTSERQSAKIRLDCQAAETQRIQFKDELETLKYSVDRTAADLENMRVHSSQLGREIKDKRKKMDTLQHQRELMQSELQKSTQKTLTSEERAQQMDQLLTGEEEQVAQLEKELARLRERQFKKAQELFELRAREKNMTAELLGGRAALRNLGSHQYKLDEEALKQQEILYTQEFQLQQLQHKLNRLEGERTDDEKTLLNARISELEEEHEHIQGEGVQLRSQLKRLGDDLRRVNRQLEKGQKEKAILEEKIDEMNLHIDTTQRELKKVVAAKQDTMVDENIIKLEVKRLRNTLFSHADEVHSLETRKLQLDTAMAERIQEIAGHKDMFKAQGKACESERQTVSGELHERISKIDKLRKRYEILVVAMSPPEGEEEHSQAYYVIKAAQEREDLQKTGDDLDAKIRKAEKEIRAMENTLRLMNSRNENFRKSLTKVDKSSEEASQLGTLEGQWRAALDKSKHRKKQVRQLEGDLQTMAKTLSSLKSDGGELTAQIEEKKARLAVLHKELEDVKAKKDRATKQTSKLVREVRTKQGVTGASDVERDIALRELRDFNTGSVQQLGGLATRQPDLTSTIQLLFSQAGLPPPPSPASSRASSVASSARSSTSQLSTPSSARSSVSRQSATPVQTKAFDIGDLPLSASSTPRAGMSPRSSTSSLSSRKAPPSRTSVPSSRHSSRPSSHASSQLSSRASSRASSAASGAGQKKDLDLTIGPRS